MSLLGVNRTFDATPPVEALSNVTIDIYPGDFVTVSGQSGSGKSTLMNIMGLLDRPTEGELLIAGRTTNSLTDDQASLLRARTIGFVFQSFHLIDRRSARANIEVGDKYRSGTRRTRLTRIDRSLDKVGLTDRLLAVPSTLSGGERQRLAIARALAGNPAILLCDEPTGNLDAQTSGEILDRLLSLHASGTTLIIVTHDSEIAAKGHRQLWVEDGCVSEITPVSFDSGNSVVDKEDPLGARNMQTISKIDLLLEVWASFSLAPVQGWLTALGSTLAVAVLILLSGLAATSAAAVNKSFDDLEPTLMTVTDASYPSVSATFEADSRRLLENIAGVKSTGALWAYDQEFEVEAGLTKDPFSSPAKAGIVAVADTKSLNALGVKTQPEQSSQMLTLSSSAVELPHVLLGSATAAHIGLTEFDLPTFIRVGDSTVYLVGLIIDSQRSDLIFDIVALPGDIDGFLIGQEITPPPLEIAVQVAPGTSSTVAEAAPLTIAPGSPDNVIVAVAPSAATLRRDVQASMSALDAALILVSIIAGVVGISGITAASVARRTREFGIRRALGARRRDIRRQVLLEAMMLGALGGGVGVGIGIAGLVLLSTSRGLQPLVDPVLSGTAPILGIFVGCLAGVYPAVRASVINPAKALQG